MSAPYERPSSRRRGVLSHWVPLVVTVTVATVGIAAWAWSQRRNDDEESEEELVHGLDYENADYGDNPAYGASSRGGGGGGGGVGGDRPAPTQIGPDGGPYAGPPIHLAPDGGAGTGTWGDSMSGALRRTPSPQQFLDTASKKVMAGVTATGAVVGKALASIREEDKTAYADHDTWSEEADAKKDRGATDQPKDKGTKRRKTVAIVVSADTQLEDLDDDGFLEHASILSHIPRQNDFEKIKLFILIYAPGLKDNTVDTTSNLPPPSISSSFSNIGHHEAQTPGEEAKSPLINASTANPAYNAVYSQALALVEMDAMVMPFTTPTSHAHMLRILQPDVVYLQESLAGENGSIVTQLQTWMRQDVILVVGAESGSGGLADSESEAERPEKVVKWWQKPERVGRGRGVVVVDSMRVHDDWSRRVQGQD